jgi:beta-lactamase superfamily II metal-dependent hydrolase
MAEIRYIKVADGYLAKKAGDSPDKDTNKKILLGARVHVDLANAANGWAPATSVPDKEGNVRAGFINLAFVSEEQQLKVFYTDVGQGDAVLIEAEGGIVIIDGGPNKGFNEVLKLRLDTLSRADQHVGLPPRQSLFINAVVVTHFDLDHYYGLKSVFENPDFEFGTLYHNGLPRYGKNAGKDLDLGTVIEHQDSTRSISTDLTDFASAEDLVASNLLKTENGNDNRFSEFLQAVIGAKNAGRVGSIRRLFRRNTSGTAELLPNVDPNLQFEILGPVTTKTGGSIRLPVFHDPHDVTETNPTPAASDSHTLNGNSIVLRLCYNNMRFLFGGDLNQPAQKYLSEKYGGLAAFKVHVNKACHHGSSDFDLDYLKAVSPDATVFSSGDDGEYDHPLPDAMGTAAKHSQGDFPLVFSTELARDYKISGGFKLGHINARSNGDVIVMAQKKEKVSKKDPWHDFPLPYPGPFGGGH